MKIVLIGLKVTSLPLKLANNTKTNPTQCLASQPNLDQLTQLDATQADQIQLNDGASVAKWLAHLPFTSEAAGSNLTKYFPNATRTQSSCEKSKSQRSAESRGFSPGIPVSSHRES